MAAPKFVTANMLILSACQKRSLSLAAAVLVLSDSNLYSGNSQQAEAAGKYKNPYKGDFKKYNPCVTHTSVTTEAEYKA